MQQNLPNDAKKPREKPSRKLLFHLIALHAVLRYKGIHQRGFLRLLRAVSKAAAVLGGGSFKLIGCAVEGSQTLALLYVVAALFMQGDAGGKSPAGRPFFCRPAPSSTLAEPIFSASFATM